MLAVGAGGGGRKQAALWPEWSVTQWLGRKGRKVTPQSAVMCSCHVRAGGGGDGRDGVVVCAWLPLREGEPSQRCRAREAQPEPGATGLAWAGRVGLTRLGTTGLLDGGIFPAQHMAEDDRGASTEQVRPGCAVGVVPGWVRGPLASIVWSRCGLGAANLLGPLIPGQLVA